MGEVTTRPEPKTESTAAFPSTSARTYGLLGSLRDVCSLLTSSATKVWPLYDAALGMIAAFLGFGLSPAFTVSASARPSPTTVIPAFGLALVLAGIVTGLYERRSFESHFSLLTRTASTVLLSWVGVLAASYALFFSAIGRWMVAISSLIALAGLLGPRFLVRSGARRVRRRVLLLNDAGGLSQVRSLLADDGAGAFELIEVPAARGSLLEVCRTVKADVVVVEDGNGSTGSTAADEIMQCLSSGVEVVDAASFVENYFRKVLAKNIDASWLVSAHLHVCRPALVTMKRVFDIGAALVGLTLTLPLWPLVSALIKVSSKGSVFYKQTRTGLFGRPFTIYKFRTMAEDAEAPGEPLWAQPDDPRVTSLGRVLRRMRMDEMPQFWNILKGDMSLVGPRPERPEFVGDLATKMPCYGWRHLVRPGATGWAQINFRYGSSEEDTWEKLSYDLYYVKHFSFALDAYICLRTLGALISRSQ